MAMYSETQIPEHIKKMISKPEQPAPTKPPTPPGQVTVMATVGGRPVRVITRGATEPMSPGIGTLTQEPSPPTQEKPAEYIYEAPVHETEQVQALRAFTAKYGGQVVSVREEEMPLRMPARRVPFSPASIPETRQKRFMVTMRFKKELPEGIQPKVPTVSSVFAKRREITKKAVSERAFAEATSGERALLTGYTILSPKGEKYIGALFTGKTEEVVKEQLMETYKEPYRPGVTELKGAFESLQSPVVQTELAFLGGAGFAKIGATKLGARVLTSPATRIGMGALGTGYVIGKGTKAYGDILAGRREEAIGGILTTGAVLGGAFLGARAQTSYMLRAPAEATVDLTKVRGVSVTARKGKVSYGRGTFEAETGELKGIRGYTKGKATQAGKEIWTETGTYIPKQKIGKVKIEPTTDFRYGVGTKTGKVTTVKTSEMRVDVPGQRYLVGEKTGVTFVKDVGSKDIEGGLKATGYIARGIETTPKKYGLGIDVTEKGATIGIAREGIKSAQLSDIKWVDISKTITPPPGQQITGATTPPTIFKPGPATPPTTPTISKVTIKGPSAIIAPGTIPTITGTKEIPATGAIISGFTAGQSMGAKSIQSVGVELSQVFKPAQKQRYKSKYDQIINEDIIQIPALTMTQAEIQKQRQFYGQTVVTGLRQTQKQKQKLTQKIFQKSAIIRPPPATPRIRAPRMPPLPKLPMFGFGVETMFGKIARRKKGWGYGVKVHPVASPEEMLKGFLKGRGGKR